MFFFVFVQVRLCFLAIVFEHLEKYVLLERCFFFQVEMDK